MRGEPTPVWDSGNTTVWEEYLDVVLVAANCLVLLITSVVGVAANTFVILAVCHQKSLQTSVNALVVNLAVVDFLRCVIDCPVLLNIITTVHERGRVHSLVCDTQMASFSFSCCVQLSTLACISVERYQAIAKPFETKQRKKRVRTLIPLTWTLAILLAAFCQIFLRDSPVYVRCQGWPRGTSLSYDTNGLYVLLPLWAACFSLITGFYMRIFALVRSHNRKIFDKGISAPNKDLAEDKQNRGSTVVENCHDPNNDAIKLEGAVCVMPSKANKERVRKRKESTMAKRAGYIIITFLLFWLPLLTSILGNFVVHKNRTPQKLIFQDLDILSVSVTCVTSLSDPIIYAAVNPQFRSEFYKLKSWVKSRFTKT
ncbi:parietopsin [Nematolebias whitei]|uniref:parietopsin n=1 Tax=Nematolebias whitei TaxID=451745 RepID=UPI0018990850|nr:parietopsin [Nematolebias whitei]